jgi:hypothetical protein
VAPSDAMRAAGVPVVRREGNEQTSIRLRARRADEEGFGFLDRHGRVDNPSATSADDLLDYLVTPVQTRAES